MKKERPKIQVIDVETQQVLFECDINEAEKAYQFAAEMEEVGLDLRVRVPTLSDTLSEALGLSPSEKRDYQESLAEEIENHDGSCCFENTDKKNLH
ncbi:MAG: hypothetical protein AB7I27_09785 [Bacteriovoracaceae bacterium]